MEAAVLFVLTRLLMPQLVWLLELEAGCLLLEDTDDDPPIVLPIRNVLLELEAGSSAPVEAGVLFVLTRLLMPQLVWLLELEVGCLLPEDTDGDPLIVLPIRDVLLELMRVLAPIVVCDPALELAPAGLLVATELEKGL